MLCNTKPYTDEQWRAIDALGTRVDRDLDAQDVRLTMGGEPTFRHQNRDAEEWKHGGLGRANAAWPTSAAAACSTALPRAACSITGRGKWYPVKRCLAGLSAPRA